MVCIDEKPYQMLDNRLEPLLMRCGDIQKTDSEYIRKGRCSIFIFVESLSGWRYASVQERRTAEDWALEIKRLLTECYPHHEKIILVMDNLNTHVLASLYKCFLAPEARSYAKRLGKEVSAWENMRNEDAYTVTWHFRADDARNKPPIKYSFFNISFPENTDFPVLQTVLSFVKTIN